MVSNKKSSQAVRRCHVSIAAVTTTGKGTNTEAESGLDPKHFFFPEYKKTLPGTGVYRKITLLRENIVIRTKLCLAKIV